MLLYLINPYNPLVSLANSKESRWNKFRIWKPLGLMVLAGMTPPEWEVVIIDENLSLRDYAAMPRPDLVGITAFTSQASRAYTVAEQFRQLGVRTVMGGIHATMCSQEAAEHVDCVVTGEGEGAWAAVLADAAAGQLKSLYEGRHVDIADIPQARHDLLSEGYAFGSVQTTRGCPLNCSFCSVSAFNGNRYRHRPIEHVIQEMRSIREKWVLIVDDNLIGTSSIHIERAKDLFRAIIAADLGKTWICQATINMADDEELLTLARRAGCRGVFIGFESPTAAGLAEVGKKFNLLKGRSFRQSVKRIQRHNLLVVGSFIMGLDSDGPGIGRQIAKAASSYGVDILNALFLTPLPGTRLWDQMKGQDRIAANDFPADWRYYTLGFPTARYQNFSWEAIVGEMNNCDQKFYSIWGILRRFANNIIRRRRPLLSLVSNLSYRNNARLSRRSYGQLDFLRGEQPPHPSVNYNRRAANRPTRTYAAGKQPLTGAHIMKKLGSVNFKGRSGNQYRFDAYPMEAVLEGGVSGVYVVSERKPGNSKSGFVHARLSTGQSEDLGASLTGGGKGFVENGANCFCVHAQSDEIIRQSIEKDLMRKRPPAKM